MSSSEKVIVSSMHCALHHLPKVEKRLALTPRALSSPDGRNWRRKKSIMVG